MPYFDTTYTNGVIAVREKRLLKEKIFRFCEVGVEDAFRMLGESGYGNGETAASVYEYENLIKAEEGAIDEFVRTYSPSAAEKNFLLLPRDFHNAKALVKSVYLGIDEKRLLAPSGLFPLAQLTACIQAGDFAPIKEFNAYLGGACEEVTALLQEEPSGAKAGAIFEKALYAALRDTAKGNAVLRRLLAEKADCINILTSLRAIDFAQAREQYLPGGELTEKELERFFTQDNEKLRRAFAKTPYAQFVGLCLDAKEKGLPMTEAEKTVSSFEVAYFEKRKFDLKGSEPFLYYVYRRRAENANVRIVFACLLAGEAEREIKRRLRAL